MSPTIDMIIKIKNAQAARHDRVIIPFSKMKMTIAQLLQKAGFVGEVEKKKKKFKVSELPIIDIKLNGDEISKISEVKIISKPSRRLYVAANEIKRVKSGYGFSIISTSKGVMTGDDARRAKLGGELLFEIW